MWLHGGLSPLGKQVIAELNRWGIMVDVSHPSKAANLQAIALSKAPVIASHSAARALANHSRNLDDEQLWAIKQNGGVVQTVAFASYVRVADPERRRRSTRSIRSSASPRRAGGGAARGGGGGGGGRRSGVVAAEAAASAAPRCCTRRGHPDSPRRRTGAVVAVAAGVAAARSVAAATRPSMR